MMKYFSSIKTISNASDKDLSFFSNQRYLDSLKNIKAKACLIENKYKEHLPKNCEPIIVKDPYLALALISNLFLMMIILNQMVLLSKNTI